MNRTKVVSQLNVDRQMQKPLKLLLSIFFCLPGTSYGADNLFLAGAEVTTDSSTYLYVGTSIPLPESNLGKGYALHLWADYQTYSYESDGEIDVSVDSLSASLGYHDSGQDHWWNARLGVVQADTRLRPQDPGNDSSGSETNLKIQLEGEKRLTADYKMIGNFEYILGRSAYWMRGRFLTRNDDNTYDGPELVYQGDPSYSAYQLGWVLAEIPRNQDWRFAVKGGFRFDKNATSGYAGLELTIPY